MARLSDLGIDFEHWCFACGRQNPFGLHLELEVSTDRAEARFLGEKRHEGYEGTIHGGIVTALLDETMGWAIFHQGIWAMTARIEVTFRQPVPLGEQLRVAGKIVRDRGRAIETLGTIAREADGVVLAEATGLFMKMPEGRRAELERRYGVAPDTFSRVRAAVESEAAPANAVKRNDR